MAQYILSHDIGTTGDKATLFDRDGTCIATSFYPYPTLYPSAGWAEQNPEDYWEAFCRTTGEILEKTGILPGTIAAVSFSGQMMAALPVDKNGRALRNSLIWADLRSTRQAENIASRIDEEKVYGITGHRLSASYSASKILWIRDNEPEIYNKTFKFIHAKDYLVARLTGMILTDYSDASGTNLLDISTLNWSDEMLDATGIDKEKLPDIVESTTVAGKLRKDEAAMSGLKEGTPVVIGGGDGACATSGAGVVREGDAYIYLGTSTWMGLTSNKPIIDPERRTFTFCHFKRGLYFAAGTMQTGGGSYGWFKNSLCRQETMAASQVNVDVYDLLNLRASKVEAGSSGLLFLPYLMGERSPLWDPTARGCFIGLTMRHKKEHMIRAVLEGVGYNMRIIVDAFREQGIRPSFMRMIGGGAKSRLWRSIFADILDIPVARLNYIEEATSVGAAIAGGVGVGLFSSIYDAEKFVHIVDTIDPDKENSAVYKKYFPVFKEAYHSLTGIFEKLTKLDAPGADTTDLK